MTARKAIDDLIAGDADLLDVCATCRWWDAIDDERLDGFCRVGRPVMQGVIAPHGDAQFQNPQAAIWPITCCDDWCGEWEGRP